MNAGQRALFLLKLTKALRTFAIGILIIIFIQNLFMKDLFRQTPFLIQISAFIGTNFICYILKANRRKLGIKNYALVGALIMTITATNFAQLWSPSLSVLVGIIGIMPVIGQQIPLFTNIQEAYITKQSLKQSQFKRQLLQTQGKAIDSYRLIGTIFKALGSLFCVIFYYKNRFRSAQFDEKQHLYLMRIYTLLCGLHFLAYLCVDSKELQSIEESENCVSNKDPNQKVKIGLIAFATFFVFLGVSFINLTNLSFFVHQKYELEFQTVAPFTAAAIVINFIGKLLAKKLVLIGYLLFSLIISFFFSLLLPYIALTIRLLTAQLTILTLVLLGNKLRFAILQKIKSDVASKEELQSNKTLFEFCKNVAIVCSIILYCIFQINTERQKVPFSYPILISACSQLFSVLVLLLCIWCLGINSSNGRTIQRDRANQLQQRQRLHFPDTH